MFVFHKNTLGSAGIHWYVNQGRLFMTLVWGCPSQAPLFYQISKGFTLQCFAPAKVSDASNSSVAIAERYMAWCCVPLCVYCGAF